MRADDMADTLRRYLFGINTGGIGVVIALASGDRGPDLGSRGLLVPLVFFVLGVITTGGSLALQKHKALKRQEAAQNGKPPPGFKDIIWRNQTYDLIAGVFFIGGIIVGVFGLMGR